MTDIVERLRAISGAHEWDIGRNEMLDEAADEIKSLRNANASLIHWNDVYRSEIARRDALAIQPREGNTI